MEGPEERGTRLLFRTFMSPRWFADVTWRLWRWFHRRRKGPEATTTRTAQTCDLVNGVVE